MVQIHALTTISSQEVIGADTPISVSINHTRITAYNSVVTFPDGMDYGHLKTIENTAGVSITIQSTMNFVGTGSNQSAITIGTTCIFTWVDDGVTAGWQLEMAPNQPNHMDLMNVGTKTHAQIDTHVTSSSNPHSVTKSQVGLGDVEDLKINLASAVDPTVNNDTTEGYVVGSRWFNTTADREFVCLDNTDGAAVWLDTTSVGSGDVVGPGSSTNNALARFDGTTGKLIQNSLTTMDDNGEITFTEGTTATKGIIYPNNLPDAFHFEDSSGNSYLQFISTTNSEEVKINQNIDFTKGITHNVTTISTDTTLTDSHYFVRGDTSGGSVTLTLPAIATNVGRQYKIVKIGVANTLSIDPNASESINGSPITLILTTQYDHITLINDGIVGWFTM